MSAFFETGSTTEAQGSPKATLHLITAWNGHVPISELGRMADIPLFSGQAGEDFAFG